MVIWVDSFCEVPFQYLWEEVAQKKGYTGVSGYGVMIEICIKIMVSVHR